jgi:hypothetical protein
MHAFYVMIRIDARIRMGLMWAGVLVLAEGL